MTQVVAHHADFKTANSNIVTISFSTGYWTEVWLKETESPFPFLLDKKKASYQAYNLKSSTLRSWSPSTIWYYAKAKLQGREIPAQRSDPHQLGGDFIIDPQGIIRLSHPIANPTDRASINELLTALRPLPEIEKATIA